MARTSSSSKAANLAHLRGRQRAVLPAVELAGLGEGDVVDVQVEPHPDGVGGDEELDVAVLEQLDLGVAGPRAECPHHHGRATALAADQLGHGVDLLGRKGDDGRATRQAGDLAAAGIDKLRHPRPAVDVHARQQPLDQRARRGRAQQQGLVGPADVEDAIGEDMAPLEVARQLDLVDRHEGDVEVAGHRLDR
jgi:hypothetical protein